MSAIAESAAPIKLDAPFYTDEELDRLYESDPVAALPTEEQAREVLDEARHILLRDGGDLEFIGFEADALVVRLKGACAGCPRSALDLKQVVEALVRKRYPAVRQVKNIY